MYRITISPDKYPYEYQVKLEKHIWWLFWDIKKCYRGPLTWVRSKAERLKEQYGVSEITDKTITYQN
jgi:hypothetical protein